MTAIIRRTAARPAPAPGDAGSAFPYINRELSSLEFNHRVLYEGSDERNPLLERVKFLAIFAGNMDEFFQIRVSGLMEQAEAHAVPSTPSEKPAAEQLAAIRKRFRELLVEQQEIFEGVCSALGAAGIDIVEYDEVPQHHTALRERFTDEIYPVLTPLAVDPGHPFPYISTLSLSLAIRMEDPEEKEERFARVKVPPLLPRFLQIEPNRFVLLEQVIAANLDMLFSGMTILETHLFRVTRDADLELQEDEADDLMLALEEELRRRRFGEAVRLEVEKAMPASMRRILEKGVGVDSEDCYEIPGMLDHTGLWQIAGLDRPDLKLPTYSPIVPPRLVPPDEDEPADVFAAIRDGDILVHHPYESFAASTQRFIAQAAADPEVLSIKMTLYRTSGGSPIVRDLIAAAELGKQVVVLVEIKARFDEEANIVWARKLEQAGAHVVYGLVGLKTHSKTSLVVRREGSTLRRYVHIGTGNYNPGTARLYTDFGLLSCRPELGADVSDLFNVLTGLSRQRDFRRLIVAPMNLRTWILDMIGRETDHAQSGREARIVLKLNSLVDPACVAALYAAWQAGVQVDLIIRGICSLWPGLPGVSAGIRVRSIVGQYLEHSRVFSFANGGRPELYIGSADLMERNLDRRVEALVPIEDPEARARIEAVLAVLLADDRRSWQLGADGTYHRTEEMNATPGTIDAFETLKDQATQMAAATMAPPHRPRAGSGSLDPRA
ncbi:MAG TPA: polyphosphate kinase 1 [Candidatus Limnocylindrales bacterium]|jgi:polyphosphate kinase